MTSGDDGCTVNVAVGLQLCNTAVSDKLVRYREDLYSVDHLRMPFGEIFQHGLAEAAQTAAILHCDYTAVTGGGNLVEQPRVERLEEAHVVYSCRNAIVLELNGGCDSVVAGMSKTDDSHILAFPQTAPLPYLDFAKV